MKRRRKLTVTTTVVVVLFAGGALAFSRSDVGAAVLRSRSHFVPSEANPRVLYEPGMEESAALGDFMLSLQLGGGGTFASLFEASFGTDVGGMWGAFEEHLRSSHGSARTS